MQLLHYMRAFSCLSSYCQFFYSMLSSSLQDLLSSSSLQDLMFPPKLQQDHLNLSTVCSIYQSVIILVTFVEGLQQFHQLLFSSFHFSSHQKQLHPSKLQRDQQLNAISESTKTSVCHVR